MRDLLLFIVLAVVIVTGVWYYFGAYVHPSVSYNTSPVPPAEPALTPVKKKTPASPHVVKKEAPEQNVSATVATPEPAAVEIARKASGPAPKPIRTFDPEGIKPGTEKTKGIELLGRPDLKLAPTERGNLVETYFYTRESRDDIALIRFRGGRVSPR